jgi:hypothetical protein
MLMEWCEDDGGRAAAGFKGATGDCVVRAIAIAVQRPYAEVYALVTALASTERRGKRKRGISNPRTGVYMPTIKKMMAHYGWEWVPTMGIGTGCRVHLREDELPSGRLVVSLSKHLTAVVYGTIHDTFNPDRGGTRCVYGYWRAPLGGAAEPPPVPAPAPKRAKAASRPAVPRVVYEWDIEEVDGEDILDHNFLDAPRKPGENERLVLVRDVRSVEGTSIDRMWAYVENMRLPETFSYCAESPTNLLVPARFHRQLAEIR